MENKEELIPWVERLKAEPDGRKRNEIVAELCKEKGIKIGDAWKLLKEAGFDSKVSPNSNQDDNNQNSGDQSNGEQNNGDQSGSDQNNSDSAKKSQEKKKTILASHKTGYEKYRCAGLVLTQKPDNYLVTEAQLEKLQRDPWVVLGK